MTGHVVYLPEQPGDHTCEPPDGSTDTLPIGADRDYPAGTIWQCDCDRTWISRGMIKQYVATGHVPASLEWKSESRRARRKRERQGVRPEQLWPHAGQQKHPSSVMPPPLSTKPVPCPAIQPPQPAE